jgi:transposase-like protein
LHLYFNGLSLRNASKALSKFVTRSHTAIRYWIQKYDPKGLYYRKTEIFEFILDETQIKVGSDLIWLWVAIEPESKEVLRLNISKERNMFVAEISIKCCKRIWRTSGFYRWRYLVSTSLSILETKSSPHPFFI